MSVSQAMVRGYNFFVVAFLCILGGSLVTELFQESEWLFRIDELLIIAIAALAFVWYLVGQHQLRLSVIPLLLALAALAAKVLGLMLEIRDAADVGDDIGIVQSLLLFAIVTIGAYLLVRYQVQRQDAVETRQAVQRETQAVR